MNPDYQFCPVCGKPLESRLLKAGDPARLVCTDQVCRHVFYLDPKVAVGTIIRGERGGLLLLRRAIEPGFGKWVFPGGYVDRGEEVTRAAIREAREEAGLEVRIDRLINVYSYEGRAPVIIVYAATTIGGTLAIDDESLEVREFSADDIPWDDLAFKSTFEALQDYLSVSVTPDRNHGVNP